MEHGVSTTRLPSPSAPHRTKWYPLSSMVASNGSENNVPSHLYPSGFNISFFSSSFEEVLLVFEEVG